MRSGGDSHHSFNSLQFPYGSAAPSGSVRSRDQTAAGEKILQVLRFLIQTRRKPIRLGPSTAVITNPVEQKYVNKSHDNKQAKLHRFLLLVSDCGSSKVQGSEQIRVATAIFPVVSLLNHSCDPNTSISFRGRTAVVRASRLIRKGEEALHCYGPHKSWMVAIERQRALKEQYFFECHCRACTKELRSEVKDKATGLDAFVCSQCFSPLQEEGESCRCRNSSCGYLVSWSRLQARLQKIRARIRDAVEQIEKDRPEQALEQLVSCQRSAGRFLSPTHRVRGEIEDAVAQAHASTGNWLTAAQHLEFSLRTVETHYGSSSLEFGQELFKLAQVLFNGGAAYDALMAICRAEGILLVHCGPESELLAELLAMKSCLEGLL
nr:PREDICTED: SET and MYND domain-containing protein 4 [Latimeria chalumnae]|eukprot:XP_006006154.2 PREDICTED: SET and MYND domain-containing protein 4 [Latimeria chalumnae]